MSFTTTVTLRLPAEETLVGAKRAADQVAQNTLGECTCMAFFDRKSGRESPAHASDCHGDCEVPGYEEYAIHRGATLKVVVNGGEFVFLYRPLGEFAGV